MPDVVVEIGRVGEAVAVPAIALDQYRARRDGVDADAIRLEFQRPALGVEISAALAAPY